MSDDFQLPNFVPVFLDWDEFLRQGKVSLAAYGLYVLLNRWCDWGTGIYYGCAPTLASLMGKRASTKEVQNLLYGLRRSRLINYPLGTGKRGSFNILINGFLPRAGRLRGFKLNAFIDNNITQPLYESRDGAKTEDGLSADGGETVFRLTVDGAETEHRPLQEYKNLRSVRILEFKESKKSSWGLGGWVEGAQPPAATPAAFTGTGALTGTIPNSVSVDAEYLSEPVSEVGSESKYFCSSPRASVVSDPTLSSGDPLSVVPSGAPAKLASRFFELQGLPLKYKPELEEWNLRFSRLLDKYGSDELSKAMEFGFVDPHWSGLLVRYSTHPLDYFEEHFEAILAKYAAWQTTIENQKKNSQNNKEKSSHDRQTHTRSTRKTAGNDEAIAETLEWLHEIQQPDDTATTD
jgi:hypothetical protein